MKFTELKESIKQGAASVYLLEGEDAYFRLKGEEEIKSAFLEMPELNFSSFEGEQLKGQAVNSLISAVRNYPFMAEKRIVKVTEFYPSEQEYDNYLKQLFEDFPPTAILLIVNRGGKKYCDLKRKKCVTYVDCSKADRETVAKWIYITFKRAGIVCPVAVAGDIADFCLSDMSRVAIEVQKIIDYKGSGELDRGEVEELVYKDADYRIYEMTNAVSRRDYSSYCAISADLKSKGFDEISVLNGLLSYFRNLSAALMSPLPDAVYAKENKMKEYAVKKTREQARAMGQERLSALTGYLYSAVSDIKSGLLTPVSALQICENFIFFGDR